MPSRASHTKLQPTYTIDLDAGVFEWLHEIVVSKDRSVSQGTRSVVPWYDELLKRAVATFNEAAAQHTTPETTDAKPLRKLRRRAAVPEPEPAPQRRGIKRRPQ